MVKRIKSSRSKSLATPDNILNLSLKDDVTYNTYRQRFLLSEYLGQQRINKKIQDKVDDGDHGSVSSRKRRLEKEDPIVDLDQILPVEGPFKDKVAPAQVNAAALFGAEYIKFDLEMQKCPSKRCQSKDFDTVVAAVRSLDEPSVTFYRCNKCKRAWKHG